MCVFDVFLYNFLALFPSAKSLDMYMSNSVRIREPRKKSKRCYVLSLPQTIIFYANVFVFFILKGVRRLTFRFSNMVCMNMYSSRASYDLPMRLECSEL